MNDIIFIELTDLQNHLYLMHCIDVGIMTLCVLGFFFIHKVNYR